VAEEEGRSHKGYDPGMTSVEAELQELRRRRRTRRIVVAVACVAVLVLGAVWLNSRKSTMSCGDWQAEYTTAALQAGGESGSGTLVNLEKVRPEGCPIPFVPGT
jgi:ferric-dicitrate binding protein FerR (iron transport regulator)